MDECILAQQAQVLTDRILPFGNPNRWKLTGVLLGLLQLGASIDKWDADKCTLYVTIPSTPCTPADVAKKTQDILRHFIDNRLIVKYREKRWQLSDLN